MSFLPSLKPSDANPSRNTVLQCPICGDTFWLYDAMRHYKLNHASEVEPTHFDVQHEKNKLKMDLKWFYRRGRKPLQEVCLPPEGISSNFNEF